MSRKSNALWNAAASTALMVVIMGTAITVTAYLLVLGGVHMIEEFGWLPENWVGLHEVAMVVCTAVLAVPAIAAAGLWMFRNALKGERQLERYADRE